MKVLTSVGVLIAAASILTELLLAGDNPEC